MDNKGHYKKIHFNVNGEPEFFKPDGRAYLETCCDCKLTHLTFYAIEDKKIRRVAYGDTWETMKNRQFMPDSDLDYLIQALQAERRRRNKVRRSKHV